ncbi:barrier-to-autointegration factor [Drosophila madeirensis]|uniref:Barrier-to-autointegration factor-like protein n=1 Tax=Drosophila madeirensis TaxID=30013 RepID=A0AAU9FTF8_DROMD
MLVPSGKSRGFYQKPIGQQQVTDLNGIGTVLGARLCAVGFDSARTVLGHFLVLKMDKETFIQWLKEACKANSKQALDCYECLQEWCECFL